MKVCTKCSHNNEDNAKFCVKCGNGFNVRKKKFPTIILLIFISLIAIIFISSLINFPATEATYLNISTDEIDFKSDGFNMSDISYSHYIKVDTDGKWDVIHPGWCKVKKSKKGFLITCLPNIMENDSREDTIKVITGDFIEEICVYQDYGEYFYSEIDSEYSLQNRDTSIHFKFYTNSNVSDSDFYFSYYDFKKDKYEKVACNWIDVCYSKKQNSINEYVVFIRIHKNFHEPREIDLVIDLQNFRRRITIQQDGYFYLEQNEKSDLRKNNNMKRGYYDRDYE